MLTDRCATMCLLVNLSLLYPSYTFLFQLSMTLDVASHWLHLHRYAAPLRSCRSGPVLPLRSGPVLLLRSGPVRSE